jgi:hypothetical protein
MIQDMRKIIETKGKIHYQVGENLQESKNFKHNKNNPFNMSKTQYYVSKPLEGFEPPTC